MKQDVLNYLKEDVRFRERTNKNSGIANLIMKKYGIIIPKEKRNDIIGDILTADRSWRDILSDHKELQGQDYSEGAKIEQDWLKTNGY